MTEPQLCTNGDGRPASNQRITILNNDGTSRGPVRPLCPDCTDKYLSGMSPVHLNGTDTYRIETIVDAHATEKRESFIIRVDATPAAIEAALAPLRKQPVPVEFPPYVVREALTACLNGDDDQAAELLAGLDADQLYAIEGAGSGLALHASRHRKRLAQAAQVEDVERCPAQTGPVWKAGGEPCGCTLARGHDGDHQCECGAWFVDSVRRDGDAEQPEPTRPDADQHAGPALYARIRAAIEDLVDAESIAPVTAAVWEEIAPVLVEYRDGAREQRHRAETAERRVEHFEEHAAQIDADLGIETQRAEQAERERDTAREALDAAGVVIASLRDQRDEQRQRADTAEKALDYGAARLYKQLGNATAAQAAAERRAERAEKTARAAVRDHDAQRDRADQAETEVRVSQGTTRELLTALADTRQRAEAAEATVNVARQQVERWRYQQDRRRAAAEMAPILGIDLSDRTDDPDAWRP